MGAWGTPCLTLGPIYTLHYYQLPTYWDLPHLFRNTSVVTLQFRRNTDSYSGASAAITIPVPNTDSDNYTSVRGHCR